MGCVFSKREEAEEIELENIKVNDLKSFFEHMNSLMSENSNRYDSNEELQAAVAQMPEEGDEAEEAEEAEEADEAEGADEDKEASEVDESEEAEDANQPPYLGPYMGNPFGNPFVNERRSQGG